MSFLQKLFGPPNLKELESKGDVKGLIKALGYKKDKQVQFGAARALGEIGDARTVKPLIAALEDEDKGVGMAAARALRQIGDARAVEPLIATLKDKDMCRAAARALGEIGDDRAVEPLIVALKDEYPYMGTAAARALGQIGDARAVEPLIATLKELKGRDQGMRKDVATALDRLGWQPDQSEAGAAYWVVKRKWEKCVEIGPPAARPLTAALEDRDVRQAVARALAEIGTPATEPLIAALKDGDKEVRRAAAGVLGQIGDVRAVGPLIDALRDEQLSVCRGAADALDRLGWQPDRSGSGAAYWYAKGQWDKCVEIGPPAMEPLIAALKRPDLGKRLVAAGRLGQIGDARAVEPLIAALKDKSTYVGQAAAEALGQIGDARAVKPLIATLKDDRLLRRDAAEALEHIGAPAVEPLIFTLKRSDKDGRGSAAEMLGRIGDARAVEPLIAALKDSDKRVREAAATALVGMYRSGKLDNANKRLILGQRKWIIGRRVHIRGEHVDQTRTAYCFGQTVEDHTDSTLHTDTVVEGIGVDFPL